MLGFCSSECGINECGHIIMPRVLLGSILWRFERRKSSSPEVDAGYNTRELYPAPDIISYHRVYVTAPLVSPEVVLLFFLYYML